MASVLSSSYFPLRPPATTRSTPSKLNTSSGSTLHWRLTTDAALEIDDRKKQWEIIREIQSAAVGLGQDLFREIVPVPELRSSLDLVLSPETFMLQFVTLKGQATLLRNDKLNAPSCQFRLADRSILASTEVPRFRLHQIDVLQRLRLDRVFQVRVDGHVRCCKIAQVPYPPISRELQAMQAVTTAGIDPSVRIPRLRGLVEAQDGTDVIGLLMDYVADGRDLRQPLKTDTVERCRKQKWADQIEKAVERLHEAGIAWGDAKAENVLIDADDNAWLIGLGGGWTDGWVDEGLRETKEGDLRALKLIREFLGL
ncbi:MAG: hypothetical protein M1826_000816 [Phylliscum demangeonii]|nr:MAG: hypothetical protein M1826_000816 [Phylliscum demangeonii]